MFIGRRIALGVFYPEREGDLQPRSPAAGHPGSDRPGNDPKHYRSFVVVSRQVLIDSRFPTVVCTPILTRGHGFSTQVSVGVDEGLKHESWILCDNLVSPRKVQLTRFVGSLGHSKIEELDRALKMALALE